MHRVADAVAVLERARQAGKLEGRDLEVIEQQVSRAELKVLKLSQGNPLASGLRAFAAE